MNEELESFMELSFSHKFCSAVYQAIKYKFPNIQNLDVDMDDKGDVTIVFDEGEITAEQVLKHIDEFTKVSPLKINQ